MQNVILGPAQEETVIKTKVYAILQYFEHFLADRNKLFVGASFLELTLV